MNEIKNFGFEGIQIRTMTIDEEPFFSGKDVCQLFEIKETTIMHSDGHTTVNKTTKVTGKGQQYFINKLLQER